MTAITPNNYGIKAELWTLIVAIILVVQATLTNADVSAFDRKQVTWDGYNPYIVRFDERNCSEYNLNNGQYAQDLTILGTPTGNLQIAPNSYGEIKRNGTTIQINFGIDIPKSSYSPDSITFDLPKSGTSGDNCTGTFYLVFIDTTSPTTSTSTTLITSPINATTITSSTPTSSSTTISSTLTPLNTTTSIPSPSFIDGIRNFFAGIFGWLTNLFTPK